MTLWIKITIRQQFVWILKKAFDTDWHRKLISELEKYWIRRTTLEWFKIYLNKICQIFEIPLVDESRLINYKHSSGLEVKKGVPQGYVLRPLLYINYITSLYVNVQSKCNVNYNIFILLMTLYLLLQIKTCKT